MDIEINEIEPCRLSVKCILDAGEILNKRAEILKYFSKAPVKGFRKGRQTMEAIKVQYRTQIEDSLKRALAEDAFHNTLFEKKLRPHGPPTFNSSLMETGKFTCNFNLNVKPDFELATYRDFELPKPHEPMSAVELSEKMMQELRMKFGTSVPYDENDFARKGDNIILDYEGSVDGEVIDNLCAQGEMITIGNSQITDFDNNLYGMTIGEIREFDIIVPVGGLPSLVGKKAHFKVTLTMGAKNEPCPLDDELAAKLNKKDFAELKEFVMKSAAAKLQFANKSQISTAISNVLVENHKVDVPNWLTLSEAQYLAQQSKVDWDKLQDVDRSRFVEMAERNVKLSLILDRIRENEPEAQVSDQEVFEIIKQNIAHSQMPQSPDEIIKKMNETGYLQILFSRIKDEYALDFIAKTVKFVE